MKLTRIVAYFAIPFVFIGCARHSASWKTMDEVEAAMEEHPDSAMAIIQSIDTL